MRCSPEVRARCPDGRGCEPWAEFTEHSECARYNEKVLAALDSCAKTRYDRIKAMGLVEMAELLDRAAGTPWCGYLESCLKDLEHDREIPAGRCLDCVIGWLLGEEELP